jgi:hypothetical protein
MPALNQSGAPIPTNEAASAGAARRDSARRGQAADADPIVAGDPGRTFPDRTRGRSLALVMTTVDHRRMNAS